MNEKNLTNAELTLLCLLAEKPMHGYEIEQIIEDRGMRNWTPIGFSSIYYLLEKMHRLGWLEKKSAASETGGPSKHIFSITSTGFVVWEKAILEALANPKSINSAFQLALSVLPLLDESKTKPALAHYVEALQKTAESLEEKLTSFGNSVPRHVSAMFELSLVHITAELDWVRKFIQSS